MTASHDDSPAQHRPRLILASASPRRLDLLRQAGYEFIVQPANIDEDNHPVTLLPAELARLLSAEKARSVASRFPADFILAADTVVAFGDRTLGKPADADDARRMLSLLAGTTHIVITGVTVACAERRLEQTRVAMSAVHMRPLAPAEIEAYVASDEWRGKAGGYGIQDEDPFVTRMAGSHTNIVGLPMELTTEMLTSVGVLPRAS